MRRRQAPLQRHTRLKRGPGPARTELRRTPFEPKLPAPRWRPPDVPALLPGDVPAVWADSPPRPARAKPKRRVPLAKASYKQAALNRQRQILLDQLRVNPVKCEVPWCTLLADDPHEPLTRARGGSIVDLGNIRLICRMHHREIHDTEPPWAYELGFLKHSGRPSKAVRRANTADGEAA